MKLSSVIRYGSAIMAIVFLLAAAVQYNDPDPLPWILVYGAAFVICVATVLGRRPRIPAAITGAVALVWALVLLPRVLGQVDAGSLFQEAGMATLEIEEAREALGLLIVALWMAFVAGVGDRIRKGR